MSDHLSILNIARQRGAREIEGRIAASEFDRLDLPFFSGCECCQASLAPYNAYPSLSGYIRCDDCIDNLGFTTLEAFDRFCNEETVQ